MNRYTVISLTLCVVALVISTSTVLELRDHDVPVLMSFTCGLATFACIFQSLTWIANRIADASTAEED